MIVYRDAAPADGEQLAAMARAAFTDTFGHLYPAADLNAFLDDAFGPEGLPAQIGHPDFTIRLAIEGMRSSASPRSGPWAFRVSGPKMRSNSISSMSRPAIWARASAPR